MAELSRIGKTKHKKKRNKLKIILFSLLGVLLVLLAGGVYAYIKLDRTLDEITTDTEPKAEDDIVTSTKYSEEPFAMLILGKDSREEDQGLNHTDVMIVAAVQPKEKQITLLSIPRDTRVIVPNFSGYKKITEAYQYGDNARIRAEKKGEPIKITGISTTKKTVEGLLGIPIKNYVTIDFEGFKKVIDELGGIEVDVERRLVYHDPTDGTVIDLQPGLQTLNGEQALGYVRHRKDDRGGKYYSSDFERNERQQLVISKVADKVKSVTGLTHIFDIMDTAGEHIRTDLSKEQIKGLALAFKSISSANIKTIETKAYWDSSISFTVFPEDNLNEIRHTLWNLLNISEEEGKARILEDSGLAKKSTKSQAATRKTSNKKGTASETPNSQTSKKTTESSSSKANNQNKSETSNGNKPSGSEKTVPNEPTNSTGPINSSEPTNSNGEPNPNEETNPIDSVPTDDATIPTGPTEPSDSGINTPPDGQSTIPNEGNPSGNN